VSIILGLVVCFRCWRFSSVRAFWHSGTSAHHGDRCDPPLRTAPHRTVGVATRWEEGCSLRRTDRSVHCHRCWVRSPEGDPKVSAAVFCYVNGQYVQRRTPWAGPLRIHDRYECEGTRVRRSPITPRAEKSFLTSNPSRLIRRSMSVPPSARLVGGLSSSLRSLIRGRESREWRADMKIDESRCATRYMAMVFRRRKI
jgi:hypothetical protein